MGAPYPSDAISDHVTVCCPLQIVKPPLKITNITYRILKSINLPEFRQDLTESLIKVDLSKPLDTRVEIYYSTLQTLLDKYAPLKSKMVVNRSELPRFCDVLPDAKISKRKCESTWRQTGSTEDRLLFKIVRNKLVHLLESARNRFNTDKITECEGDPKELF